MNDCITDEQVLVVSAAAVVMTIGALCVLALVATGLYFGLRRLTERLEARRERRQDLAACRAIEALGTTCRPDQP